MTRAVASVHVFIWARPVSMLRGMAASKPTGSLNCEIVNCCSGAGEPAGPGVLPGRHQGVCQGGLPQRPAQFWAPALLLPRLPPRPRPQHRQDPQGELATPVRQQFKYYPPVQIQWPLSLLHFPNITRSSRLNVLRSDIFLVPMLLQCHTKWHSIAWI